MAGRRPHNTVIQLDEIQIQFQIQLALRRVEFGQCHRVRNLSTASSTRSCARTINAVTIAMIACARPEGTATQSLSLSPRLSGPNPEPETTAGGGLRPGAQLYSEAQIATACAIQGEAVPRKSEGIIMMIGIGEQVLKVVITQWRWQATRSLSANFWQVRQGRGPRRPQGEPGAPGHGASECRPHWHRDWYVDLSEAAWQWIGTCAKAKANSLSKGIMMTTVAITGMIELFGRVTASGNPTYRDHWHPLCQRQTVLGPLTRRLFDNLKDY
jgi:hypothetical protein